MVRRNALIVPGMVASTFAAAWWRQAPGGWNCSVFCAVWHGSRVRDPEIRILWPMGDPGIWIQRFKDSRI